MSDLLAPLGNIKLSYTGNTNRISSFGVQNFAGIKSKDPIQIKPFTLLTGKSGSGKTSFLSALRLLKKFIRKSKDNSLCLKDSVFESYYNIVHEHNKDNLIKMNMVLERSPLPVSGDDIIFRHLLYNVPDHLELSLTFDRVLKNEKFTNEEIRIKSWEIKDPASGFHLFSELDDEMNYNYAQHLSFDFGKINKILCGAALTSFENNLYNFLSNASQEEIGKIEQIYAVYRSAPTYGPFLLDCPGQNALMCNDYYESDMKMITSQVNKILGIDDCEALTEETISEKKGSSLIDMWTSSKLTNLIIAPFYHYVAECLKQTAKSTLSIRPDLIYKSKSINGYSFNKIKLRSHEIVDDLGYYPKGWTYCDILSRFDLDRDDRIENQSASCKQIHNIICGLVLSNDYDMLLIENPELFLEDQTLTELVRVLAEYRDGRKYVIETKSDYLINEIMNLVNDGQIKEEDVGINEF